MPFDQTHDVVSNYPIKEPVLLFLGTSSSKSTPWRSTSSVCIFNHKGAIMVDVGNGALGQLYETFGSKQNVFKVLLKLKMIFITHLHSDHHNGLMRLL